MNVEKAGNQEINYANCDKNTIIDGSILSCSKNLKHLNFCISIFFLKLLSIVQQHQSKEIHNFLFGVKCLWK